MATEEVPVPIPMFPCPPLTFAHCNRFWGLPKFVQCLLQKDNPLYAPRTARGEKRVDSDRREGERESGMENESVSKCNQNRRKMHLGFVLHHIIPVSLAGHICQSAGKRTQLQGKVPARGVFPNKGDCANGICLFDLSRGSTYGWFEGSSKHQTQTNLEIK